MTDFKLRNKVAPSILAANQLTLLAEIRSVEDAGADFHHFDVMDGHFVPNLTFGLPLLRQLKAHAKIPIDVHLMVSNPDAIVMQYIEEGADILVFHAESAIHAHRLIQTIHQNGCKAGIAINPATPVSSLKEIVRYADMVNLMSVNPGFSGQEFIKGTISKIKELVSLLNDINRLQDVAIEIDGGIDEHTADAVCAEGANVLVAGAFVYGSERRPERIATLKRAIAQHHSSK